MIPKEFDQTIHQTSHLEEEWSESYSVVMIDAKHEWASRIANGSEVTGFNVNKMPQSEYMPMMC